jgi:hypothetical protein
MMPSIVWVALAIGSLALAAAFGRGLGVPKVRPPGTRGAIIRWGHAIVWVLVALMFVALAIGEIASSFVPLLGLTALATYLVFLGTLMTSHRG